jgi:hypothetical protein
MLPAILAVSLSGSLAAGVGNAFDYAGVGAELRLDRVSVSAAFGVSGTGLLDPDRAKQGVDHMPALGVRVYSPMGVGFLAFTWSGHHYERSLEDGCGSSSGCWDRSARLDVFSFVIGGRRRLAGAFYLDGAVGVAGVVRSGHPSTSGSSPAPGPFTRTTLFIPDAVLAFGYEF